MPKPAVTKLKPTPYYFKDGRAPDTISLSPQRDDLLRSLLEEQRTIRCLLVEIRDLLRGGDQRRFHGGLRDRG